MRRKGWSDLPPDLLREIAGRLHVAADFVSFHAVCKPWRHAPDQLSRKQFLPWLLVPTERSSPLRLRCVFSKSSYRMLPAPYPRRTNWVCSADGATVWYLTVRQLRPTLHDPITGAVTDLPCFPCYFQFHWEENENPYGIVYGDDGTTFLYAISCVGHGGSARFRAAFLLPGQAEWTLVDRTFRTNPKQGEFGVAYHSGRILVTAESVICRLFSPDGGADMLLLKPLTMALDRYWYWDRKNDYILESQGELLWASVHVSWFYPCLPPNGPNTYSVWVSVYAIEEATAPEKVRWRWVTKENHCLADRVLFLGSPNSFAVDASLLGGQDGCAYFVSHLAYRGQFGVFRYSFVHGKGECIDRLPDEWNNEKWTWIVPQPTIAPVHEIIRRKLDAQILKKQQKIPPIATSPPRIFHIERHYEHRFRVLVHNLPLKVKNSQLQLFFGKHGKVSSIKIIYQHENTKVSHRIGIVRMATMHAHQDDALAALDGMDFDGCLLEVILVNNCQRPRRHEAA